MGGYLIFVLSSLLGLESGQTSFTYCVVNIGSLASCGILEYSVIVRRYREYYTYLEYPLGCLKTIHPHSEFYRNIFISAVVIT